MKPLIPARLLGAFSAVLLALGATGPLAKATLITAYLNDVSTARVVLLLIIAAVALVLSLQGKTRLLRWTALAAVLTLASLGLGGGDDKYIPIVSDVLKLIMDVLKSVFTDVAKAIVHLQWGGYCLLSGLLLMGGTGFIKAEADAG